MYKSQKGFTLIELVVVIVLLGILGVTALGRFQNLSLEAQNAANQGIASELTAASTINFAAESVTPGSGTAINTNAETCAGLGGLFNSGALPAGYTFAGGGDCTAVAQFTCNVDNTANTLDTPAPATVLCTP